MSKESFIGGDYIETTGGSNKTFAKGPIELIGSKLINDGKKNGVLLGMNKNAPNLAGAVVTFAYIATLVKNEYHQIQSASVGDTVYVIVRTTGLVGRKVEVNLINSDGILSSKTYGITDLLQDDKDSNGLLSTTVGKDGLAIYKVKLQPTIDTKGVELWSSKLQSSKNKKANLCILVDARKHNKDLKITYLGTNPTKQANTTSLKAEKPNYWQDGDGKWFELKYCECCSYTIENELLNGSNVIHKKTGSKVKSTGSMQKVKALVLHRTAGYSTISAVGHTKGTHFYVDGPRGNDGEIFQPFGLDRSSSHIRSSTDKTRISRKDIENNNSIGIEVVGMNYSKDKKGVWKNQPSKDKKITKGYKDYDGEHSWDQLSTKQINSLVCIVKKLMEKYNLSKTDILVHEGIQQKTGGEGQAVYDTIISKL